MKMQSLIIPASTDKEFKKTFTETFEEFIATQIQIIDIKYQMTSFYDLVDEVAIILYSALIIYVEKEVEDEDKNTKL